jgi:hypothetical protein
MRGIMSYDSIIYDVHDHLATITLSRPGWWQRDAEGG